ncbi:MAG: hydroxyacid dehydrogenase [Burkholderiales bacterium]|nr:hydroxyacid dehydrogenase [Burkholderiales bacterium]
MARIVISEIMDAAAVAQLAAQHEVIYDEHLVDAPARLLELAPGADALIVRNRTQVRGALLDALARCRVVGRLGVGLDNIDTAACAARGLPVIPATGANANSVAEYVITAALVLLRGAWQSQPALLAGLWPRNALGQGREAAGKTLGLVGFGSIGQHTARLAAALGMQVIAFDTQLGAGHAAYELHRVRHVGFDELMRSADVVSLHVPLVHETRMLIDAARIETMKPGAVLVDTARGGIVDEAAVAAALRSGRLGGAAFDVFAEEPLKAAPHFDGCPNLLLTPHIAGVTAEANERVSTLIAAKVLEALR